MRRFIDAVQSGGALESLLRVALLFLATAFAQQIVAVLSTYVSESVGWAATNTLRGELAIHCLSLDLSFHNTHTPGEMIERIDGDVTALSNFFSRFMIQILGNLFLMVGILILLFLEDWRIGLSIALFALAALFILGRFRSIGVPYWAAERQSSAELFGFLEERLAGTEDIRSNGAKAYVMKNFYRLMRELFKNSLKAGLMVNLLINSMFVLFAIGNAMAFTIGAYLFQDQAVTIGTVYIIFQYTTMLQRPIEDISRQMQDLQRAGAGILRVQQLFDVHSKLVDSATPAQRPVSATARALAVSFQSVTFSYHDSLSKSTFPLAPDGFKPVGEAPPALPAGENPTAHDVVLRDVTFQLAPGKVLGLLGRTGSGKTSLTRLLFRLYDPDQGTIRIAPAGQPLADIRNIPLKQLRRQIGMITQNIQLFNASVRDNLTFFDERIPDEKILEAVRELGLWDWYLSLPDGLRTELESGGSGLSAGEAQLLAFTRIFLRDPGLVILDEASSRLDPATEHRIEAAVDRLVQGRSAIIVAHRLGTVQRAQEIMILESGRILEFGSGPQLANDPHSNFHKLLKTGLEDLLA